MLGGHIVSHVADNLQDRGIGLNSCQKICHFPLRIKKIVILILKGLYSVLGDVVEVPVHPSGADTCATYFFLAFLY